MRTHLLSVPKSRPKQVLLVKSEQTLSVWTHDFFPSAAVSTLHFLRLLEEG